MIGPHSCISYSAHMVMKFPIIIIGIIAICFFDPDFSFMKGALTKEKSRTGDSIPIVMFSPEIADGHETMILHKDGRLFIEMFHTQREKDFQFDPENKFQLADSQIEIDRPLGNSPENPSASIPIDELR